jgi:hypothetical protein
VQPQVQLLLVALGIQRQQAGENVVTHGIGQAVAPGQLAAAADGAAGQQLALDGELAVGRIIGAVAQAGFTGDQETALIPAVGRASEQLFSDRCACGRRWA